MAIQPEERIDNVKRALFDYIETNYTTTTKEFQGSNFLATTAETEWVWFGIVGFVRRRPARQIGSSNWGNFVTILVQAIVHVKPTETITRIDTIRDNVVNVLRRAVIQVVDRVGSTGNLGKLYGNDILDEVPLGIDDDINRYAITFSFDYIEEFSQ